MLGIARIIPRSAREQAKYAFEIFQSSVDQARESATFADTSVTF